MDLFDYIRENDQEKESPLAGRLRPVTIDEVVGQQHIIGKDKLLYRAIRADKLPVCADERDHFWQKRNGAGGAARQRKSGNVPEAHHPVHRRDPSVQ